MNDSIRHVCFDLDNTLVDDTGRHLRPGIRELLEELKDRGITLSLWTGSVEERAQEIFLDLKIGHFFSHCIFRNDYDPYCEGQPKDIARLNADLLVDDRICNIDFVRTTVRLGFMVSSFSHHKFPPPTEELQRLKDLILSASP